MVEHTEEVETMVGRSIFAPIFLLASMLSKNNGNGRRLLKSSFSGSTISHPTV